MKKFLALALLAGCASRETVLKPVPVEVPVAVPCPGVSVVKPDFALAHVSAENGLGEKTKAALIELRQRQAYEAELEARVDGCR